MTLGRPCVTPPDGFRDERLAAGTARLMGIGTMLAKQCTFGALVDGMNSPQGGL